MTDEEVLKRLARAATRDWVDAQFADGLDPTMEEVKHFYSEAYVQVQIQAILTEQILACEFDDLPEDDDDY